jgi:hypothetical protein
MGVSYLSISAAADRSSDAAYKQKAAENPTEPATPEQIQEAEKKR